MLGAVAALIFLLLPLAALAAVCGCADGDCPYHGGRGSATTSRLSCHEGGAAQPATCDLLAPCPHGAGPTPVLAYPPAVLTAALAPRVPPAAPAGLAVSPPLPRQIARAVTSPPPRARAV